MRVNIINIEIRKSLINLRYSLIYLEIDSIYADKGYGLFLDLTADKVSGTPAIQAFTLKNGDFISNKFINFGDY